ncbi:MAG: nucleotidyltransferase domain-containing protein [bacterium]
MIEKLFSSKARVEILKLFLFNPDETFYQRSISKTTRQRIRGVQREVARLESVGLIERSVQGNRVYYKSNRDCPIFEDLTRIFLKTVGVARVLKESFRKGGKVKIAFIYGSYARGEESLLSDIDLLVIGSISSRELSRVLSKEKEELGREINYVVFTERELVEGVRKRDHFVREVLKGEKVFVVGSEDELKAIATTR